MSDLVRWWVSDLVSWWVSGLVSDLVGVGDWLGVGG